MKQATVAAIRFGYGLGPSAQPATVAAVHDSLRGPDVARETYPLLPRDDALALRMELFLTGRATRNGEAGGEAANAVARKKLRAIEATTLRHMIARRLDGPAPLRERLHMFWLDHFTARHKSTPEAANAAPYIDETVRATMTLRFADMLRAVVTDPRMMLFLDQTASVGPNSVRGKRRGQGLNENLAREVLELHTLGVSGAYSQSDVRELAKLLTGLQYHPAKGGFKFVSKFAEPGAETILGHRYGGRGKAKLADIFDALEDLSVHPDTAGHMAQKLAVHFVSDTPDPALVRHMTQAWQDGGGDLMQVYTAMLEHPAAWSPVMEKAKQPFDFVVSSLRALGYSGQDIITLPRKGFNQMVVNGMRDMGQTFLRPSGPDGWKETAEAWITPVGLATRIRWAMASPGRLAAPLPDPREFVVRALDDAASPDLIWAASAADTVAQGVGLILASPEFNRR
ncbi:DUF1800 domain-containing protein [Oceaniglobus ichthyenteri]|uniref:DUF1800 domain-containing protein n=1 Tax=Oceaniglobus ichthyenteri TaxID=2136177 RepID=UPI000D3663B6|nr:DUF1800 domain-containing protein [Oceaniglobus ichthyenteri]